MFLSRPNVMANNTAKASLAHNKRSTPCLNPIANTWDVENTTTNHVDARVFKSLIYSDE